MRIMLRQLDEEKYWFATSEAGVHLNHRNNLAHDVAIYDKAVLPPSQINAHCVQVPAKIDVRIDLRDPTDTNYVNRKARKLLGFDNEKVISISTDSRQVLEAERGAKAWLTMDWHRPLELLDGQFFNVGQYLADEGVGAET